MGANEQTSDSVASKAGRILRSSGLRAARASLERELDTAQRYAGNAPRVTVPLTVPEAESIAMALDALDSVAASALTQAKDRK